ncbi:uncharacterized protein LOC143215113 [Lasioglossum baleicum]|uniref:uncharacterized protein LOC143215113 n=1 Tax=Lasioglossum baleicum TaxID=434251 RepID=UPI003FCCEEE2
MSRVLYNHYNLKNVKTTSDNFQVAWEKLSTRYENPRRLVQAQIQLLASLAPMKRESAEEMKRLYDDTFDAIDALDNLGRPVTNALDWIVELTVERWDQQSQREWEDFLKKSKELPTLEQLKEVMEGRIQTRERLEASPRAESSEVRKSSAKSAKVHQVSRASTPVRHCNLCQEKHFILFCSKYQEKTPVERKEAARSLNLCFNCLGKHSATECKSSKRCQKCEGKHHTTIHDAVTTTKEPTSPVACVHQTSEHVSRNSSVLPSTARVAVSGTMGQGCLARSLIDPGSEVSLISESLAQRLGVQRRYLALRCLVV